MTLLEILVAFALLALGSIGLFSMSSMSSTGTTRNADRIAATALASSKLEDLLTSGYDALTVGTDIPDPNNPLTAGGASGGIFTRTWTISSTTISGVSTPAKSIAVKVTWPNGGTVTMTTMLVNPSEAFTTTGLGSGFPTVAIQAMEQTQ